MAVTFNVVLGVNLHKYRFEFAENSGSWLKKDYVIMDISSCGSNN